MVSMHPVTFTHQIDYIGLETHTSQLHQGPWLHTRRVSTFQSLTVTFHFTLIISQTDQRDYLSF